MPHSYQPSQLHLTLGDAFFDPVEAADFPKTILRYRNQIAAEAVGLEEIASYVEQADVNPEPISGRQEYLENVINRFV